MSSEIRFEHVTKRFGRSHQPAVDDLDMTVPSGSITTLVGPSGCGKTTTLKMINRLENLTEGTIRIGDRDIMEMNVLELRRSLGYVIQHVGLFPHMSVMENVAAVPRMVGWSRADIRKRVDELLELLGMPPDQFRRRMPRELSGGQQQRVGVARGLAVDPPILLMDEPFGALDPITRERLQLELLDLQKKVGKTIVFVTHDIDEAILLGDRIAVMRDGKLIQYDTPAAILSRPADKFVSDIVGRDRAMKYLKAVNVGSIMETDERIRDRTDLPEVESTQPLEDALLRIMDTGIPEVRVLIDGRPAGMISLMTLVTAARSAADEGH